MKTVEHLIKQELLKRLDLESDINDYQIVSYYQIEERYISKNWTTFGIGYKQYKQHNRIDEDYNEETHNYFIEMINIMLDDFDKLKEETQ